MSTQQLPPRPIPPPLPSPESIPALLRAMGRWICWRYGWVNDRWTKEPIQANQWLRFAKSNDASTWGDFDAALAIAHRYRDRLAGIGFMLGVKENVSGLTGIDLDHCCKGGAIEPWARTIVERINSYTEISPSGEGLRIFVKGRLPGQGNRTGLIEMYDTVRFLTVTGAHVDGTPFDVLDRQEELSAWHREVFGLRSAPTDAPCPDPPTITPAQVIDPELLALFEQHAPDPAEVERQQAQEDVHLVMKILTSPQGEKFSRLFTDGDISAYGNDHSKADYALLNVMVYWTQEDAAQLDRLFRESALCQTGARIKKWNRLGQKTIARVLAVYKEESRGQE